MPLEINTIHLLDAVEGLKQLGNESADIVLIDPPYNIGKDFGNDSDKRELEDYINWSKTWIDESIRILKPTGSLYIYGFSEILCFLFPHVNLNKRWLIWHYTNKNAASNKFWQRSHESIILGYKENRIFNLDEVREKYTDVFLKNAAGKIRKPTPGRFSKTEKETIYTAHKKGALPRDVIKIPALAGGAGRSERFFYCLECDNIYKLKERDNHNQHTIVEHPTQKPYALTKKLLLAAKPQEKGLAVVPFAGTGSEIKVAKDLQMDYVGFEINPNYVKMGLKLISN